MQRTVSDEGSLGGTIGALFDVGLGQQQLAIERYYCGLYEKKHADAYDVPAFGDAVYVRFL